MFFKRNIYLDTYLHSSGVSGMPKSFFNSVPPFWFEDGEKLDLKCPVYILHPEHDELCPIEGSTKLVESIGQNAKLEILNGAKHSMSAPEDLEVFEKSLSSFYHSL